MKRLYSPTIIFLAWALLPSLSWAANPAQRLCTDSDLAGKFSMVDLHETPKGQEAQWFEGYPYHYLEFYPDHTYAFVASAHKMSTTEDLQKAIMFSESLGSRIIVRKYTLDESGVLNLYLDDALDYSYRCMIALKPNGNVREGDLVFIGYSKQRTELNKTFRHWP